MSADYVDGSHFSQGFYQMSPDIFRAKQFLYNLYMSSLHQGSKESFPFFRKTHKYICAEKTLLILLSFSAFPSTIQQTFISVQLLFYCPNTERHLVQCRQECRSVIVIDGPCPLRRPGQVICVLGVQHLTYISYSEQENTSVEVKQNILEEAEEVLYVCP